MDRGAARRRLRLMTVAAVGLVVLANASVASAMTRTVANTNDSGTGSLRADVAASGDGDTVAIPAGFDIPLTTGPIAITKQITIMGGGSSTIVDGGGTSGVFLDTSTSPGAVVFQNLKITGGNVTASSSGSGGAAIDDFNGSGLTLNGVTISNNTVTVANGVGEAGGAVLENNTGMTVTNSSIINNTVTLPSGGNSAGPNDGGAGLYELGSGVLTITNSTLTGNSVSGQAQGANNGGGAVYNQGDDDTIISGSTLSQNTVSLTGVASSNKDGGGALYHFGASLSITGSTIDQNTVMLDGSLADKNGGGGVYNDGFGSFNVTGSTIAENTVTLTGATTTNGGGGLYDNSQNGMTSVNSTFSENFLSAPAGGGTGGGGILENAPEASTLSFVTVADNSSNQAAGAIQNDTFNAITLKNSLIAGNGADDCATANPGSVFTSAGYNLEQTNPASCGLAAGQHDQIGVDPLLGALANNGGAELTQALGTGSPAINAIPVASCTDASGTPVTTDERGMTRPTGGACDIGAYESNVIGGGGGPPTNTGPPAITGTPLPGDHLNCSTGTWTNSPTGFTYLWSRDGTPIAGATGSTYVVQILDEATTLMCTVTATNPFGVGSATSPGVLVAVKGTTNCPKPSGSIHGSSVGPLTLGITRTKARHTLKRFKAKGKNVDDFCLFAGWGIRVAYPSASLLHTLTSSERRALTNRIVLALTANPHYALGNGITPGVTLSVAAHNLKLSKPFVVGSNTWYFVKRSPALGLLKVRHGVIQEVGLAQSSLNRTAKAQRAFLKKFNAA